MSSEDKKKRVFKKFTYRGVDLDRLLDLNHEELMSLFPCRARRKFARGLNRKQLALIKKLRRAKQNAATTGAEKPDAVKTHLRNLIIVPEMIGSIVGVYNGKEFAPVEIKAEMIGHYLGEFSLTYKPTKHGRPGIGATYTILKACESSGVQFMDGTMWMHHPRTTKMKEVLSDHQRFGQLKSVHSSFSYVGEGDFLKNDIRVNPDLDSLGALGDTGWYSIRAILWAHDYELPKTVTALRDPEYNELGVILSCGASLKWKENGNVATFYCSLLSNLSMDIIALGTKGNLRVHDFVIPFNEKVGTFYAVANSKWVDLSIGCEPEPSEFRITTVLSQEVLMVQEFARLVQKIRSGETEPEKKWPILSRKTQAVIDAVVASIKNGFEPVEVVY